MVVGELPKQPPLDATALHCILREPWGLRAIVLIVRPTVTICYYLMLANGKKTLEIVSVRFIQLTPLIVGPYYSKRRERLSSRTLNGPK